MKEFIFKEVAAFQTLMKLNMELNMDFVYFKNTFFKEVLSWFFPGLLLQTIVYALLSCGWESGGAGRGWFVV